MLIEPASHDNFRGFEKLTLRSKCGFDVAEPTQPSKAVSFLAHPGRIALQLGREATLAAIPSHGRTKEPVQTWPPMSTSSPSPPWMPFFFGSRGGRLFGCHHLPSSTPKRNGVILCYPIGHEYELAHRAF